MRNPKGWHYRFFTRFVLMGLTVLSPSQGFGQSPARASFRVVTRETDGRRSFDVEKGVRQLFLDDHVIADMKNLKRVMHQPVKKGAVIQCDQPWETVLQTRCAPVWDKTKKVFKLWLITSTPTVGVAGTTYVESKDGLHWTKPVLEQYNYLGSKKNNFVTPDPTLQWPNNAIMNVVYDSDDPNPARRYKGFLGAINRKPIVSTDGIRWKLLEVPPIPSADESNLSYDLLTGLFIATLKTGGPYGRSHAIWTSKDFGKWTNSEIIFHTDKRDQELGRENIKRCFADRRRKHPEYNLPDTYNVDVYNLAVFRYEGLYLGMPALFHQTGKVAKDWPGFDKLRLADDIRKEVRKYGDWTGFHQVQLACSRDLRNWTRLGERQPFLDLSPVGDNTYDTQVILPPSRAVVRGDELWFYYTGLRSYAYISAGKSDVGGAICLAVLRRDGFVSLDAGDQPGTLVTKPFVLPAGTLHVNAAVAEGSLRVAVCDEAGQPLKGFKQSGEIHGDRTGAVISWPDVKLQRLHGRTVRLRFTLQKGKLYSYWIGEPK